MAVSAELEGRTYLIVEDEYLTGSSLILSLEDAGAGALGPFSDVPEALRILAESGDELDGAVLDVNVRGTFSYPLADALVEEGSRLCLSPATSVISSPPGSHPSPVSPSLVMKRNC